MINFNTLSPKSKITFKNKKIIYKVPIGDTLFSPVDGNVLNYESDECDGNLMITFTYDGNKYIMSICGIKSPKIKSGFIVNENSKIGISTKRTISLEVLDEKNKPVKISKFSDKNNISNIKTNDDNILKNLLQISLSPIGMVGDTLKPTKKESTKNQDLLENIQRIKKLLK